MSDSSKSPRGAIAAALGALLALGSLWLPWYTVRISDAFREMLGSLGASKGGSSAAGAGSSGGAEGLAGAFAGLFKGLAAVMPEEITASGWTAMDGGDIAIAVAAGAIVFVVLLASSGGSSVRVDRGLAGRLMALGGLVVAAVAVYHFVNTPGGGLEQLSGTVDREPGIFVAIAGGILMLAGGLMTAAGPRAETPQHAGDVAFAPPEQPPAMPEPAVAAGGIAALQPFAAPDAAPAPDELPAPPDPFVALATAPGPIASQKPAAPVDPFADQPEAPSAPSYTPLGTSGDDGFSVPDWAGFSEPEPGLEPAGPQPAPPAAPVEAAAGARPAGVSIPPPGWTGA